jgi:orotidine-5'-phosphate decarboxylase
MNNVIIACDFKDKVELYRVLNKVEDRRPFLKIGMELFYSEGPLLIKELKEKGFRIFLDLKLHDIPTTVHKAMKVIGTLNVDIVNVHASGGIKMMREALSGLRSTNKDTKLVAVTQLTSTSDETLKDELLIKKPMNYTINHYAKNTKIAGLDGVVCSPLEAPMMNELELISVTPGIRFKSNNNDDQVRVTTPVLAKELGSTYIVVGRAITASNNPLEAYDRCVKEFN